VGGVLYHNTKLHPAYSASSYAGHKGLYEKLKRAKTITVYYNPHAPQEAYIVKGRFSADLAPFFGGLVFFFAGLTFLLAFWFAAGKSNYDEGVQILEYKTEQPAIGAKGSNK
jgi:hypothetical protein